MQRNRNDEVRILISHEALHPLQDQERERFPQMCLPAVLE